MTASHRPKYQIFVSSTYEDLKEQRDAVIRLILEIGHIPVGMEMFSAGDDDQWRVIQRTIDQCDYYLVIVAHRYGSMRDDVSYTEREFDYAVTQGVPAFGFIIKPQSEWNPAFVDIEHKPRLDAFKDKVKLKMVSWWESAESLRSAVAVALSKGFEEFPRPGWVRAQPNDAIVAPEVARLSAENAELRQQLEAATAKVRQSSSEELRATFKKMRLLEQYLHVWPHDGTDWHKVPEKVSLADIFLMIAPSMIAPATTAMISGCLGAAAAGIKVRAEWPVAMNLLDTILADLATLGLVRPSLKQTGPDQVWKLTAKGRALLIWYNGHKLNVLARDAEQETQ